MSPLATKYHTMLPAIVNMIYNYKYYGFSVDIENLYYMKIKKKLKILRFSVNIINNHKY